MRAVNVCVRRVAANRDCPWADQKKWFAFSSPREADSRGHAASTGLFKSGERRSRFIVPRDKVACAEVARHERIAKVLRVPRAERAPMGRALDVAIGPHGGIDAVARLRGIVAHKQGEGVVEQTVVRDDAEAVRLLE